MLDDDGQPRNTRFNARLRSEREVDELLGLCKGIIADDEVNQKEFEFLYRWLELNREVQEEWPGDILYSRMRSAMQDGRLDKQEEIELISLLMSATGGDASKLGAHSLTANLPLNTPQPPITFPRRSYCFTGKLLHGSRPQCESEVIERGGVILEDISRRLDFLVIGVIGSRDWAHSSFGRKIEKAVKYRQTGVPLAIVSEQHFVESLAP